MCRILLLQQNFLLKVFLFQEKVIVVIFHSPADLPNPIVTIAGIHSETAGSDFILTCTVKVKTFLIVKPTVQWSVGSGNGVIVGDTTHSGVMSMRTLTFSPLRTSHGSLYTCQADIYIPSIDLRKTKSEGRVILVESK